MMQRLLLVLVLVGAHQQARAATPAGPTSLAGYLAATKATRFAELLGAAKVDAASLPGGGLKGTLFVPSNAALERLAADMGLTWRQLLERRQLADLIAAYQFMPGYALKSKSDVPKDPTVGISGDANFILRFSNDAKKGGLAVQDVQGNSVAVAADPLRMQGLALVPIDAVLMSGAYFTSPAAALKHYPAWSTAAKLAKQSGSQLAAAIKKQQEGSSSGGGVTWFVPSDAAFAADAKALTRLPSAVALLSGDDASPRAKAGLVAALPAGQAAQLLAAHVAAGVLPINATTPRSSQLSTLAAGSSPKLQLDVSTKDAPAGFWSKGKTAPSPAATVGLTAAPGLTAAGSSSSKAAVKVFNVFAGRDVMHGIDRVLLLPQQAAASDNKPAAGSSGAAAADKAATASKKASAAAAAAPKRLLLQQDNSAAAFAAQNAPGSQPSYLQRNTQSGFLSDNPALTFGAQNTAQALRAATDGQGEWDRYMWYAGSNDDGFQQPVNKANQCFNCGFNAPQP